MPTRSGTSQSPEVQDYRHDDATRRNNPPAGIASHGGLREKPKQEYAYNPHLPPILRFDDSGAADQIPELLEKAKKRTLRRRNQNPRRRLERPRPLARMGGQTGGEILRRRSGGSAYPRTLKRKSHPESCGTPRCPTPPFRRPAAGVSRGGAVLPTRRGLVESPHLGR